MTRIFRWPSNFVSSLHLRDPFSGFPAKLRVLVDFSQQLLLMSSRNDLWLWNSICEDADNEDEKMEFNDDKIEEVTVDMGTLSYPPDKRLWTQKRAFELKFRIEPSPFFDKNHIYFCDHSGIYKYQNDNDRCKIIYRFGSKGYSPTQYSYIFNACNNEILFVGGRNIANTNKFYDVMMAYNLTRKKLEQMRFGKKIGTNPKMILVQNNKVKTKECSENISYLHIVGGSHNTLSLCIFVLQSR